MSLVEGDDVKYGIRWYVDDGEHSYKDSGHSEHATLREALEYGRQEDIHWITDNFGFAFCQPSRST